MYSIPGYFPNMSMRLSNILDDVGVNDRMVNKRRRANILNEMNDTITHAMLQDSKSSTYWLGSRTEGTTTPGLASDVDILTCMNDYNVIQERDEMKPDAVNLLMVNSENTPPGYCYLQVLQDDLPTPVDELPSEVFVTDSDERLLFKNTPVSAPVKDLKMEYNQEVHGPSLALSLEGTCDMDLVFAFPCSSWPKVAVNLSNIPGSSHWPTYDMLQYAENSGCLLVPAGSKFGENTDVEWRISTCLAERSMMFNLNITQIRCYVLMKMLLKTFINRNGDEQVSSFMCKSIVMHHAVHLGPNIWREDNLFQCLTCCLLTLQKSISSGYCPHVFIPANNLMAWRFSAEGKRSLNERLANLIQSNGLAMLGIQIDDVGQRLFRKVNVLCRFNHNLPCSNKNNSEIISGSLYRDISNRVNESHLQTLAQIHELFFSEAVTIDALTHCIQVLAGYNREDNTLEQLAISLLAPLLYSTLASVISSCSIGLNENLPVDVHALFSEGLNSDVASGRLKLASTFYCIKDWENVDLMLSYLQDIPEMYSAQVICGCYNPGQPAIYSTLAEAAVEHTEDVIKRVTSLCVKCLPCEINCVPKELQYEMFRSTSHEMQHRLNSDIWMDWAVVDSLPYLYFLQYKTYGHFHTRVLQQRALANLVETIRENARLRHRETAFNLLGQCLEQENRLEDALQCYMKSFKLRETNNVARVHMCMLLSKVYQEKQFLSV